MRTQRRWLVALVGLCCTPLMAVPAAHGMPNAGPLVFTSPTPGNGALVTAGTINIRLDAECTVDPATIAVSFNGSALPAANFLPFTTCTAGRKQSQIVTVNVPLPDSTITAGPSSLTAGDNANFTGSGSGNTLQWNFDGGSQPATGSSVSAIFNAAGTFVVRLQSTSDESLAASALDNGNLVVGSRAFLGGDPTPASQTVSVEMPPEVDFRNYESSHVHPIALSASGAQLYAVNTPEARLAIFNVAGDGSLSFAGDVPVGLDPVSLAVRPGSTEVWVTNHLSDTVSVVDVSAKKMIATIATGDEPNDIAFANGRAFVTLGGNQDGVNVYDGTSRAQITSISLFSDTPRALATNSAGTQVYAIALESGNQTTTLFSELVTSGGGPPAPNPPRNPSLGAAPATGLIVKFNQSNSHWEDDTGGNWSSKVNFTLPDNDLFVIDATAATPSVTSTVSHVGTILYDVAARPGSSELWVPNTDARNQIRFEPNLRGHLVQTRLSKVNPGTGTVTVIDLNPHINYATTPGSASEIAQSLSQPGMGVFNAAGSTYYLTAFGSRKVGVLNASGTVTARIDVGGGPSGVALNEPASRLYVLNRFDNTVSTVNTTTNTQIAVTGVAGPAKFDPSPDVIKTGRKFLYDAQLTSGHGDIACASCHIFSNFDNLAWDLGDPQGDFVPFTDTPWVQFFILGASTSGFDPMKGPMTTQTLRGLQNLEPFHWRGDRQNFQHFNGAFVSLMGMEGACSVSIATPCAHDADCPSGQTCLGLSSADMDTYTDFINTVNLPPNPFRNLDNTMPNSITVPSQSGGGATATGNPNNGANIFVNNLLDANAISCNQCHAQPKGTNRDLFNGNAEGDAQDIKIPQLRNMYEKVGFNVIRPNLQSGTATNIGTATQKRGFGFLHDGSLSLTEFLAAPVFTSTTQQERDLFAFMLAFGTESAPCVGTQVTVDATTKNNSTLVTRINTLVAQAEAGNCDVIAKGSLGGIGKGFAYDKLANTFTPDSNAETPLTESALRGSVSGSDLLTYTGVPSGDGVRLGIDRDRDTFLDRTEISLGTDPANPNSNPWQF